MGLWRGLQGQGLVDKIREEIRRFEEMREELVRKYRGKYVTLHEGRIIGSGDSYDAAVGEALRKVGPKSMVMRRAVPAQEEHYEIL